MKLVAFVKTMNGSLGFVKQEDLLVVWGTDTIIFATILHYVLSFDQENSVDLYSVGRVS
jgi:hypothetical protein